MTLVHFETLSVLTCAVFMCIKPEKCVFTTVSLIVL